MRGEDRADRDPLDRPVAELGEPQEVQRLLDPAPHHVRGQAQRLHAVRQLVLDGVGDEVGERVLAHRADQIGEFTRLVRPGVPAVDRDPAGQHAAGEVRHETGHGTQQSRLADTGRADGQHQFALGNREVDA